MIIKGNPFPTTEQELLLKAALFIGDEAVSSWTEWKKRVDMDKIDSGSYRLLPLLYRNLAGQGVDDPLLNKPKGVYRLTWYKNQMLFHKLTDILRVFHNAGIRTMILKGAALTLLHYRDRGARPMDDVDIVVPVSEVSESVDLLMRSGWKAEITPLHGYRESAVISRLGLTPRLRSQEEFTDIYCQVRHAHSFKDPGNFDIDLHWHLFSECCSADADEDFWTASVPTVFQNTETKALNPADQLMHVCVHGCRWNEIPPIRWIADAMSILKDGSLEIDWQRISVLARKNDLALPVRDALCYLKNVFHAPVPSFVIEDLNQADSGRMARIQHSIRMNPPGLKGGIIELSYLFEKYKQMRTAGKMPYGPLRFYRHVLGIDHAWQIPLYAIFEAVRRPWRQVSAGANRIRSFLTSEGKY